MTVFEITLVSTENADNFDDWQILWVVAESKLVVTQALEGLSRLVRSCIPSGITVELAGSLIDAHLPQQTHLLRQRVQHIGVTNA